MEKYLLIVCPGALTGKFQYIYGFPNTTSCPHFSWPPQDEVVTLIPLRVRECGPTVDTFTAAMGSSDPLLLLWNVLCHLKNNKADSQIELPELQ